MNALEKKVREMISTVELTKARHVEGDNGEIVGMFVEVEFLYLWDLARLVGGESEEQTTRGLWRAVREVINEDGEHPELIILSEAIEEAGKTRRATESALDENEIRNPDTGPDDRPRITVELLAEECEAITRGEFASLAAQSGIMQIEKAYTWFIAVAADAIPDCKRGPPGCGVRCHCKACSFELGAILADCSGGCSIPCSCPAHTRAQELGFFG